MAVAPTKELDAERIARAICATDGKPATDQVRVGPLGQRTIPRWQVVAESIKPILDVVQAALKDRGL
jgi:hypothetical protein